MMTTLKESTLFTASFLFCVLFIAGCSERTREELPVLRKASPLASTPSFQIEEPSLFVSASNEMLKSRGVESILPRFDLSEKELQVFVSSEMAEASEKLLALTQENPQELKAEAFLIYDDILHDLTNTWNTVYLIMSVSPDSNMREIARELELQLQKWFLDLDSRKDIFDFLQSSADASADRNIGSELKKYMSDVLNNFKRNGLSLKEEDREEVKSLRKELASVSARFGSAIQEASKELEFEEDELRGVDPEFLASRKKENGKIAVKANVTSDFLKVMENAFPEATRQRMAFARYSLAQEENSKNLQEMISLRRQIASRLGYESWADYRTSDRMAGSRQAALDLLLKLKEGFEPKFQSELAELKALKKKHQTTNPADILSEDFKIWDFRYYLNQLKKEKFSVDTSDLQNYFQLDRVKAGVFKVYGDLFQIEIEEQTAPSIWDSRVEFYSVRDRKTNRHLGFFYLDLFPREGKYQHFAHFGLIDAKELPSDGYRRPVSALVCNFPEPKSEGEPSLLTHDHVETFFHEFGHLMHSMMTQARISFFSGTAVERDFVEAPSQMFEAWAWDKTVLDQFAEHYKFPGKTIDQALLDKMKAADLGTKGFHYRRQLTFGIMDMRFHGPEDNANVEQITNDAFAEVFLPAPEGTLFSANFGHMDGYDAGYYGYAWADVISQDLLSAFENADSRMKDIPTGLRLRKEIYEVGGTRSANESIRAFLGRDYSIDAFLKKNGVE